MMPASSMQTPFDISRSPVNWEPPSETTSLNENRAQLQGRNVEDLTKKTSCNPFLGGVCAIASLVCCVSLGLLIACFVLIDKENHFEDEDLITGFMISGMIAFPLSIMACVGVCKAWEDSE